MLPQRHCERLAEVISSCLTAIPRERERGAGILFLLLSLWVINLRHREVKHLI